LSILLNLLYGMHKSMARDCIILNSSSRKSSHSAKTHYAKTRKIRQNKAINTEILMVTSMCTVNTGILRIDCEMAKIQKL
jgi:hypothetical protein